MWLCAAFAIQVEFQQQRNSCHSLVELSFYSGVDAWDGVTWVHKSTSWLCTWYAFNHPAGWLLCPLSSGNMSYHVVAWLCYKLILETTVSPLLTQVRYKMPRCFNLDFCTRGASLSTPCTGFSITDSHYWISGHDEVARLWLQLHTPYPAWNIWLKEHGIFLSHLQTLFVLSYTDSSTTALTHLCTSLYFVAGLKTTCHLLCTVLNIKPWGLLVVAWFCFFLFPVDRIV